MLEELVVSETEKFDENFTLRIARTMRERIDRLAAQEKRSAGYIARLALERGLEEVEQAAERGERL